ncbi:MAG: terpene synthase [Calothrix sp. FI2-JRJ7]|jgi:5-epi-alpha-selinene synthase|nr:terpene synthase [Calothrix sp. FI2-JRJ7]
MEKIIFPDLYCPFPLQVNKHVNVLEDYALEWVTRFNVLNEESAYERFRKSKFYLLAASAYPSCQLEELKIANDVISWLFIWDDQCDMSDLGKQPEFLKSFCNRFIEILNGAELTKKDIPLGYALSDIRKRIIKRGNITFFHHFVHNFEDYFHGCLEEANNRLKLVLPALESYTTIRSSSAAAALCLTLIEFCDQVMIPYFLRNNEIINKINRTTINILAWSNDIFSFQREMLAGEVHNLVLVLKLQNNSTIEDAITCATELHNKEVKSLADLEASIPSFGKEVDGEIAKYLSGLHSWICGNLNWYSYSGRYEILVRLELFAS